MLQKIDPIKHSGLKKADQDTLKDILKTLEALSIKHPIAEVSRRTGFSKSQVSEVLGGKIGASENFKNAFDEHFTNKLNNNTGHPFHVENSMGALLEALVRIEARQIIHDSFIAEIFARLTEQPATKVLKEMQTMGNVEVSRLLAELRAGG